MKEISYGETQYLWDRRPSQPRDDDRLPSETALYLIENDYSDCWLNAIRWNITELIDLIDIGKILDTVSDLLWIDIVSLHIEHWKLKAEDLLVVLHWVVKYGVNASSLSRYETLNLHLATEPIDWAAIVSRCQSLVMMNAIQSYAPAQPTDQQAWILHWFNRKKYKPLSKSEEVEAQTWNMWIKTLSVWANGPLPLLYNSVRRVRRVPLMAYGQHEKLKIVRDYYPLILAKAAWFQDASVLLHDDDWDPDDLHTYHVIFQYKYPSDYAHWMALRTKPYVNNSTSNMHMKWLFSLEFNMPWVEAVRSFENADDVCLPLPE